MIRGYKKLPRLRCGRAIPWQTFFSWASPAIPVVALKAAHSIQELARKHAPEAIQTLADIAKDGTPGARVSAAVALLDRGYGKPPQFNTNDAGSFKRAVEMSDDELAAIAARAKLTVV